MENDEKNPKQKNTTLRFLGLLTILFIGLKLGGVTTWSWIWVLAPLWLGFGLGFLLFMVLAGIYLFGKPKGGKK